MSDCIFCRIVNNEMPSVKLYEDENFIAIFDKFPTAKGHILVMPKKHEENIFEASNSTISMILPIIQKICLALKKMGFSEINVLQNNGVVAGQTVMHLHFHIIPRAVDDNVNISFNSNMAEDSELLELKEEILKYI